MKKVCNGYVTEVGFVRIKPLIINAYVCNGYVTDTASHPQLLQKILFDWKTASTTKKVVKPFLSRDSLFDGYLTEH